MAASVSRKVWQHYNLRFAKTLQTLYFSTMDELGGHYRAKGVAAQAFTHRFGNHGITPLANVEIQETPTALILTATMPPLPLEQIKVQLTPEYLFITGEQVERMVIVGYCDVTYPTQQFESLFRLPCLVQPTQFTLTTQGDRLVLTLPKLIRNMVKTFKRRVVYP